MTQFGQVAFTVVVWLVWLAVLGLIVRWLVSAIYRWWDRSTELAEAVLVSFCLLMVLAMGFLVMGTGGIRFG